MTVAHHELLPDSYLLILAPGVDATEAALAQELRCARQSGKPAVWVDCSLLTSLSAEAARQLWATHHRLQQLHVQLVLVHVPEQVKAERFAHQPGPCIVPTLLDAARQPRWFPETDASAVPFALRAAS